VILRSDAALNHEKRRSNDQRPSQQSALPAPQFPVRRILFAYNPTRQRRERRTMEKWTPMFDKRRMLLLLPVALVLAVIMALFRWLTGRLR
jgi:hypothetical protein